MSHEPTFRSDRSGSPEPASLGGPRTDSFPFEDFRKLRFGGGSPHCLYCGSSVVQRWGGFSGRQRYRCTTCRRTFSDFTGTPLAWLKRIDCWAAYCDYMRRSCTLRRTAAGTGVHLGTAFRWRHRILGALESADDTALGGTIVFGETWFPYSEKGRRSGPEHRREPLRGTRPGARVAYPRERVWVFVAVDERGRVASGATGSVRPRSDVLAGALGDRVQPGSELVDVSGPFGAVAVLADRVGARYRRALITSSDVRAVRGYVVGLRRWIRRFRGVATRYLDNYLAWNRALSGMSQLTTEAGPHPFWLAFTGWA